MPRFSVTFLPHNRTVSVEGGQSLLEAARDHHFLINAYCGGKALCGKCVVRVLGEDRAPVTEDDLSHLSQEELDHGLRLACRLRVNSDLTVRLFHQEETPPAKLHDIELYRYGVVCEGTPRKLVFTPRAPSLEDLTIPFKDALGRALLPGAACKVQSLAAVRQFADLAAKKADKITLILEGDSLAAVEEGDTSGEIFGAAVDIGTTSVALYLCDLTDGSLAASCARTNSQAAYGEDVMSRISYCSENSRGRDELGNLVRKDISVLAGQACGKAGADPSHIYRWVMAGNTTMQHLFLGLDPLGLGQAPYLPSVSGSVGFDPSELGLAQGVWARGTFLPTVAGHVGADTVGVALAARLDTAEKLTLAVDLGTNGEIVLADKGRLLCCSTAAGPAFEGARIQMGMRAVQGAVDRFRIDEEGQAEIHVIGEGPARGICGSGLMDVVSELRQAGLIDRTGKILSPEEAGPGCPSKLKAGLIRNENAGWNFVLSQYSEEGRAYQLILSQRDVRELQLACGAVWSGIQVLLGLAGRRADQIERVILTGAFGHFLNPLSAKGIGLIRGVPVEKIESLGNGAGIGAMLALLSSPEMVRAQCLAEKMEFVELAGMSLWQEAFTEAMIFPGDSE